MSDAPDRLPTLFAVVLPVLNADRVWIFEHEPGHLEADAVLRPILPALPFVPLKAHDGIVVTPGLAG